METNWDFFFKSAWNCANNLFYFHNDSSWEKKEEKKNKFKRQSQLLHFDERLMRMDMHINPSMLKLYTFLEKKEG